MLNPNRSKEPTVFAGPTMGPFGHGDRVGSGPNGLDNLPGRLADPPRDPSVFSAGPSPGSRGQALLGDGKMPRPTGTVRP